MTPSLRVFIAGIDGYLGWPLALYLAGRGHVVAGADLLLRRRWVREIGSDSVTPIADMATRCRAFDDRYGRPLTFVEGDLREYPFVAHTLRAFRPDAVVHLGEMPSAPYSMMDVDHAVFTQTNNLVTTLNLLFAMRDECRDAHLVKLGTMGEYGTPNLDIPEGFFEIEYRGRRDTLPFPRQAGSWYHWSKVHDSNNVMFACRLWGLRSTDIMQGVVFGTRIDEMGEDDRCVTRFDVDQCFGTVINRFCAQAVLGHPLTPYGAGGQRRGFLPLRDSIACLTLAIEQPPAPGEYRVLNQFDQVYDVQALATRVQRCAAAVGIAVEIAPVENPRVEQEGHYYRPDRQKLLALGYQPASDLDAEIGVILRDLSRFRPRLEGLRGVLLPDIRWDGTRRRSAFLERPAPASGRT
jgi:UDP-sulfoquinovose synthase